MNPNNQAPFVSSRSARKKLDIVEQATAAQAQMWPELQAVVDNHANCIMELQMRCEVLHPVPRVLLADTFWARLRWLVRGR